MTTRYQKRHYEDVARLLQGPPATQGIIHDFADLFAADNPDSYQCGYCGTDGATSVACPGRSLALGHSLVHHKGFDRERFLEAYGLGSEGYDQEEEKEEKV